MSTSTQRLGPYSVANRVSFSAMEDPTTGMNLPADGEIEFFCSGTNRIHVRDTATGSRLDINGTGTTTGNVIAVEDADDLTTGNLLYLYSNATNGLTRSLIKVVNDDPGAILTTCIYVQDDGEGTSTVFIDKNGTTAGGTIVIDTEQAGGDVISIQAENVTDGNILKVYNAGSLTSGHIADFISDSDDDSLRSLVRIVNGSTSATSATCLELYNDAAGIGALKIRGVGTIGINFRDLGSTDALFDCTAGTGSTAAPQTNAPAGFVSIMVDGSPQWIPYYGAT